MHDESTDLDDDFGHWLAGFTDGEGCFYIARIAHGHAYQPRFIIGLRDDDSAILEEIQRRVGTGNLNLIRPTRSPDHQTLRWTVRTRSGCLRLVEIFDRYPLRAKKARDYAVCARR